MQMKLISAALLLTIILPFSLNAEEAKAVDCDEQFEKCIQKCEESSSENCESACDEQYNQCLEKEQTEE